MSNDRHDDKRVSAAYKNLAQERTPEHLDDKILEMAASSAGKPAYSRWMAWSRPVAWAATITLCLAITFELLRDPAIDVSIEGTSPVTVPESEERKRDDGLSAEADIVEESVLAKDRRPTKEEIVRSVKPADMEMQQDVAEAMAETALSDKTSLARSAARQSFNERAPAAAQPDAALQDAAGSMRMMPDADESTCSADARATASEWLDCIRQLEAAGLNEAAAVERELLIDTFPDFKLP